MSAIEEQMLAELQRRRECDGPARPKDTDDILLADGFDLGLKVIEFRRWVVLRELPVDRYRLDFAIVGGYASSWWIAVECDGHDYHERTKDQAAHDRRRDRYLQREGWHVMRFTGSEIYRDVGGCVDEIIALALDLQEKREREFTSWCEMYEQGRK